jgi:hypothetical protein
MEIAMFLFAILSVQTVRAESVLHLTLTPVTASETTHSGVQVLYTLQDAELQRTRLQLRFDSTRLNPHCRGLQIRFTTLK